MTTQSLNFSRTIDASPAEVYRAFTNSTSLREWFSDVATVDPKPRGRFYAAWNSGFYACGEYTELTPNEKAVFTWQGRHEPGQTSVEVTIRAQDGTCIVELVHAGLGSGAEWSQMVAEATKGWQGALKNLASVLETGQDLRFMRRPMLVIGVSDFNAEIASQFNIPVPEGVRLDTTLESMGAHAAGLRKHDVIISLAGHPVSDFASLDAAVQNYHADDTVEVVFYRGPEKKSVDMVLSRRPLPDIPTTAQALADFQRKRDADIQSDLDEFFTGVSDAEASYKPDPDDWSIKEVLAHLIQGEHYWQFWMVELMGGCEAHHDGWGGNNPTQVAATASIYPTLQDMLVAFQRARDETIALLARLPENFVAQKGSFWRLAFSVADDPFHHRVHMDQMKAALAAARSQ
ncbi:MAG: SRPBCC domain-containing protein [Anaerolineales bacterium]|nr:MAG: SRPBCC domain-containing protein [Anaerolineales bacterium]